MPKVLNKNRDLIVPGTAIFIGRPSPWGNPFVIGRDGERDEVIEKYRLYLLNNPELLVRVRDELRGMDLVCFCAPEACHGEVLIHFANFEAEEI